MWHQDDPQGNESAKPVYIYALASSNDPMRIRYIGQTVNLVGRLSSHILHANKYPDKHISCWIRKVLNDGFNVIQTVVEKNAVWNESEIRWIAEYRANGYKLVNVTDGGGGVKGHKLTDEHKAILVKANTGRKPSDSTREALSRAKKKMWEGKTKIEREEIAHKSSIKLKGRKLPESTKAKMSKSRKGAHHSPRPPASEETRKKLSDAAKGRIPSNLAAIHASMVGREIPLDVRMKISATLSGRKQNDESNDKRSKSLKATFSNPLNAEMLSERAKKTWATRRKNKETKSDLE